MGPEEAEKLLQRRRRTLYLLAGGAVSLLLPLAGIAYLKLQEAPVPAGPTGSLEGVFDRRDAEAPRYVKAPEEAASVALPAKPSAGRSGSMDFISMSREMRPENVPLALETAPPKEPPAPSRPPSEEKKIEAAKKPAHYPRLKRIESGALAPSGFSEKALGRGLPSQ